MHVFNVFLGPLVFGYLEPIQAAFSSLLPRTHSLNRQLCIVKNFPSESVFFSTTVFSVMVSFAFPHLLHLKRTDMSSGK